MPRKALPVEVGKRYGMLTLLKDLNVSPRKVLVKCDCGNEEEKYLTSLSTGKQTMCSQCSPRGAEKELTGKRFGRLLVIGEVRKDTKRGKKKAWKSLCDCGKEVVTLTAELLNGNVAGCGHSCSALKHPLRNTPTYTSWVKMLSRCRGDYDNIKDCWVDVQVCDYWNPDKGGSFENFAEDMGERPEGMTLNRVRGSKIYSKETCEWATLSVQSYDQRISIFNTSGKTGVYWRKDRNCWAAQISVNNKTLTLYNGESFEDAVKAREEAELKYYGFTKE